MSNSSQGPYRESVKNRITSDFRVFEKDVGSISVRFFFGEDGHSSCVDKTFTGASIDEELSRWSTTDSVRGFDRERGTVYIKLGYEDSVLNLSTADHGLKKYVRNSITAGYFVFEDGAENVQHVFSALSFKRAEVLSRHKSIEKISFSSFS